MSAVGEAFLGDIKHCSFLNSLARACPRLRQSNSIDTPICQTRSSKTAAQPAMGWPLTFVPVACITDRSAVRRAGLFAQAETLDQARYESTLVRFR
jgi:hypothetical protein